MTTELTLTPEQNAEVATKKVTWASNGEAMTRNKIAIENEVRIKLAAQALPTDINKLADYDATRKELRSWLSDITEKRKVDTSKLDAYITSRMAPEKEITYWLAKFDAALLTLKQEAANKKAAEDAKKAKDAATRAEFEKHINAHRVACANLVNDTVLDYYTRALSKEEVTEISPEVMAKMAFHFGDGKQAFGVIPPYELSDDTQKAIWAEVSATFSFEIYQTSYIAAINEKFAHFPDDKRNAEVALAQAKYEKEQAAEKLSEEAILNDAMADAAALSISSEDLTIDHKALKKSYAVDMSEMPTAAEMMEIDKAFITLDGYNKITRIKDLWKLSMAQKSAFIGKCKTEDNALQIGNIKFKEVSKL